MEPLLEHRDRLEALYEQYNRREFVHPDPLEFLYGYDGPGDREVVALIASALAYGRVAQILSSVAEVLIVLGPEPARFLERASHDDLLGAFDGFKHRFTTGPELAALLFGTGLVRLQYGSLEECFAAGLDSRGGVLPGLSHFVRELNKASSGPLPHLLPSPEAGSACKRLNLFLRWLVRCNAAKAVSNA